MNFDQQPAHFESGLLRIDKLVVGPLDNNVYIVRDKTTGVAVLVDAANEHELIIPIALGTGVRQVLTTHGHWDHIGAVTAARDAGIDVGIGAADADMLPSYDFVIGDGDVVEVGSLRLRAISTPGHTPGSLCFVLEDHPVVFTGDTLFPGGPGKTTTTQDFATILDSVDRHLFRLAPDARVMCGHGLDTTIGTERPHLDEWAERGW